MPTDKHGVTHAGSLGLFDDEEEITAAECRAERHERERLGKEICRYERHAEREHRKASKAADRVAKGRRPVSWMGRLFSRAHDKSSGQMATEPVDGKNKASEETNDKMPVQSASKLNVVRRPETPEAVYTAEDIDPVDSLWLRECGMVRVKSDDYGGCHIVPKSSIAKND